MLHVIITSFHEPGKDRVCLIFNITCRSEGSSLKELADFKECSTGLTLQPFNTVGLSDGLFKSLILEASLLVAEQCICHFCTIRRSGEELAIFK